MDILLVILFSLLRRYRRLIVFGILLRCMLFHESYFIIRDALFHILIPFSGNVSTSLLINPIFLPPFSFVSFSLTIRFKIFQNSGCGKVSGAKISPIADRNASSLTGCSDICFVSASMSLRFDLMSCLNGSRYPSSGPRRRNRTCRSGYPTSSR
jgi:hypothetical protein